MNEWMEYIQLSYFMKEGEIDWMKVKLKVKRAPCTLSWYTEVHRRIPNSCFLSFQSLSLSASFIHFWFNVFNIEFCQIRYREKEREREREKSNTKNGFLVVWVAAAAIYLFALMYHIPYLSIDIYHRRCCCCLVSESIQSSTSIDMRRSDAKIFFFLLAQTLYAIWWW